MTSQSWWRLCLIAGIAVIVVQLWMGTVGNTEPCGPSDGLPSILAFELVCSPSDVDALFGSEPCRGQLATAMDQINTIDVFAFIPAFTSFLIFAALALQGRGKRISWMAVIVAIAAGLCDQAEDQILLDISSNLPGTQPQIDRLFWFVRGKFALLGVAPILIGSLMLKGDRLEIVLAVFMIVGGGVAVIGAFGPYQVMAPGIGVGWVALLAVALRNSFGRPESKN